MPAKKDACPKCGGIKDSRAATCRACVDWSALNSTPRPRMEPRSAWGWMAVALATAEIHDKCIIPTAWQPQPKGYIRVAGKMLHRLAAEAKVGRPLTPDETVDHTCHNADPTCSGGPTCLHRRCINVDHLDVVDAVTNWERGRQGTPAIRRAKTHCPNNHPYAGRNLRAGCAGRACKACARARAAGRDPRLEPAYV